MKKLLVLLLTVFALNSCEEDTTIIDATADKKMPKVDVCHYDADTDTWKTLSINENALKAHLAHGDYEGECSKLIDICHYDKETNTRETISIRETELAEHLEHGDYEGECREGYTYVPDDAFELQLIDLGYDEAPLDNFVLTANINTVTSLDLRAGEMVDITGIEDFANLENFSLTFNHDIKNLDLSHNKNLKGLIINDDDGMETLDISNNPKLEEIILNSDLHLKDLNTDSCVNLKRFSMNESHLQTVDFSKNKNLEYIYLREVFSLLELDVSQNFNLKEVRFHDSKIQSNSLDFSNNTKLDIIDIYDGYSLTKLNLKNDHNTEITFARFKGLDYLTCIQVDDETSANSGLTPYDTWQNDTAATYSEDCGY